MTLPIPEQIERLRFEAERFRRAIESCDQQILRPLLFDRFPRGRCGDASDILGSHLREMGLGRFEYVLAYRGVTHAWLEQDGIIIDITADQFPDGPAPIIVTTDSAWHRTFTEDDRPRHTAGWDCYDSHTAQRLYSIYQEIRKHLS